MKLKDIAVYAKDRIETKDLSVHNYISTENMMSEKGGVQNASSLPSISFTSGFTVNDVLTSNIRPYFRKIWFSDKVGGCSNDVLVLRAKGKCNPKFLYYVLSDNRFFDYSTASAKGTKMPRGDKSAIMEYDVPNFDITEQTKIANFLSSLDDKIALNQRINDNLEEQAENIYDKLFHNETLNELVDLGDVIQTTSGGTPRRSNPYFYEGGTLNWVKSKELNGTFIINTEELITDIAITKSAAKILPENSVLIAMYGATVGEHAVTSKQMACNQAVCALLPNNNYPYSYLFMFAKRKKEELINKAIGSAQQNISQILVKQLLVSKNVELIKKYDLIVRPFFEKIKKNVMENEDLSQIRDSLLPKLMSGEISVEEINDLHS